MFKALLVVVALAHSLSAQRPERCFDFGECVDGILLGASQASDVNDCLGICGDTDGCGWMTYYADPSNPDAPGSCFMYEGQCTIERSCDISAGSLCVTGESYCDPIQCNINGACEGTLASSEIASDILECEALCVANINCAWYTYSDNIAGQLTSCNLYSECLSFSDQNCQEVDGVKDCVSGQPACIFAN